MIARILLPITAASIVAAAPAVALAAFPHTVATGESLSSVAAADGMSVNQLAAANGLSPSSQLIAGSTLMIPPQQAGYYSSPAVSSAGVATGSAGAADGDSDSDEASTASSYTGAGSYLVQPGDTLSAIAARAGLSVASLAAANGLDPDGLLLSGSVLHMAGSPATSSALSSSSSSAATSQPVGTSAQGASAGAPYTTPETVSPSEVGAIAAANGVPPSLAQAIADQESGFNNALTSSAGARGVMQIMPGTWNWIGQTLAGPTPLSPASAYSNVRAGVLYLRSLLQSTGGNQAEAAAGYYQGLRSVQRNACRPPNRRPVRPPILPTARLAPLRSSKNTGRGCRS